LAYNLGNLWRWLVLPTRIDTWSLTSCWAKKKRKAGEISEKCRRGRAAGRMPGRPKVVTTARSRQQRMSTGAQVHWRIMRLLTNDGEIGLAA
jgi:hypothetical protein